MGELKMQKEQEKAAAKRAQVELDESLRKQMAAMTESTLAIDQKVVNNKDAEDGQTTPHNVAQDDQDEHDTRQEQICKDEEERKAIEAELQRAADEKKRKIEAE